MKLQFPISLWKQLFAGKTQAPEPPKPGTPPSATLALVLQALVNAPTSEQKKALLKAHPELLGPGVEEVLFHAMDEPTKQRLDPYRRLLGWCRQMGIDAAFEEVERQNRELQREQEIRRHMVKVFAARTAAEMELAIREEPRVINRAHRETFMTFLASHPIDGIPLQKFQPCLDLLVACERDGIDPTFDALRKAAVTIPPGPLAQEPKSASVAGLDPGEAFNQLIRKFAAGNAAAEVAGEAITLMPHLPPVPRTACLLLAMVASARAGDHAQARQLAVRLNQVATGWDLPGVPSRSLGPAVEESKNVDPILEALDSMGRQPEGTADERAAIRSLAAQYTERKAR